ncbi:MAG: IgGFc-binding protein [Nannocystis sp.]|nr:IgGFc-binding protein [Nannocystis sp.]MBA3546137.1 IgGFc-binding protein [Nannocystis sp.]
MLAALPLACAQPAGETAHEPDVSSSAASEVIVTTSGAPTEDSSGAGSSTTQVGTDTGGSTQAVGPGSDGTAFTSSGGESSTTTNSTSSTGATDTGEDSSGGETGCVPGCSPEYDQVLCDDVVVETCGSNRYCVDGGCQNLGACDAAALLQRSEGCDFWAVKTELNAEAKGACFAVFVANTGTSPAHLTVAYGNDALPVAKFARIPKGQGQNLSFAPFDSKFGLPVGEVAILFLSQGPGNKPLCPAGPAIPLETQIAGTGRGKAFHITSDVPVAAYQMQPFGGGSAAVTAASLLLPTSVWDTSYIAVSAGPAGPSGTPLLTFVAREDDTHITLRPKVAVVGGPKVLGGPAGSPLQYTLARGESLQINQNFELTGSQLLGNRAFAVFGGSTCLNVPLDAYACDGAHQQIAPIHALGSSYAAVRYRNRVPNNEESPPWRLVGAANGTTLVWSPKKPAGAPNTLEFGQIAEFNDPGPFTVRSQGEDHPFYASAYMTGGQAFGGAGDPEWVNLIPSAQYQKRYIFFTDPTYSETELVVVRREEDGSFADVKLDCAGNLVAWKPLGGGLEWTRVQLVTGNFNNVGNCANGRHTISSTKPFGVTVWGWGSAASELLYTKYVSYAYPAGATIRPINTVSLPK